MRPYESTTIYLRRRLFARLLLGRRLFDWGLFFFSVSISVSVLSFLVIVIVVWTGTSTAARWSAATLTVRPWHIFVTSLRQFSMSRLLVAGLLVASGRPISWAIATLAFATSLSTSFTLPVAAVSLSLVRADWGALRWRSAAADTTRHHQKCRQRLRMADAAGIADRLLYSYRQQRSSTTL